MPADYRSQEELRRIGERIARARRDAGLTQAELGSRVGVTNRTIYNWEKGTSDQTRVLAEVAESLGTSRAWLLRGEHERELASADDVQALVIGLTRLEGGTQDQFRTHAVSLGAAHARLDRVQARVGEVRSELTELGSKLAELEGALHAQATVLGDALDRFGHVQAQVGEQGAQLEQLVAAVEVLRTRLDAATCSCNCPTCRASG